MERDDEMCPRCGNNVAGNEGYEVQFPKEDPQFHVNIVVDDTYAHVHAECCVVGDVIIETYREDPSVCKNCGELDRFRTPFCALCMEALGEDAYK